MSGTRREIEADPHPAGVERWSGRETLALRQAMRVSVREFADKLGVSTTSVGNWESKGSLARLRYETQSLLDTLLARASAQERARFLAALSVSKVAPPQLGPPNTTVVPEPDPQRDRGLAVRSRIRTRAVLDATTPAAGRRVDYHPPARAVSAVSDFLGSRSRVFILTGGPGSGKSSLAAYLAAQLADWSDFQIHRVDGVGEREPIDLATTILRFGSVGAGEDPLLTLEQECQDLDRPLTVIIDGANTREITEHLFRQVDGILRQVTTRTLRFFIVARTPPEPDPSPHPILAASTFGVSSLLPSASFRLEPWTAAEARRIWDSSRQDNEPRYTDLSRSIQDLIRLPLYLQLVAAAGDATPVDATNAFRLLDYCVTAIVRASSVLPDATIAVLTNRALADAASLIPPLLLSLLGPSIAPPPERAPAADSTSARFPGSTEIFGHDVIREFFLARLIGDVIATEGQAATAPAVAALNQLAVQANLSPALRSLFELVVYALGSTASDILASIALSPTVDTDSALPLMIRLIGDQPGFASDDVLRTAARRCDEATVVPLARALLSTAAITTALGDGYFPWLAALLRRYGSTLWDDIAAALARILDVDGARQFLQETAFADGDIATFIARHYYLFIGETAHTDTTLDTLISHSDWRVRAALAEGLAKGAPTSKGTGTKIISALLVDPDYKVRAAVPPALRAVDGTRRHYLLALLRDASWHVRASTLDAVISDEVEEYEDHEIAALALDEATAWTSCPGSLAALVQRLAIIHGRETSTRAPIARSRALFRLLRETRTSAARPSNDLRHRLLAAGDADPSWLVRREAAALRQPGTPGSLLQAPMRADEFRNLRGARRIQTALDTRDLGQAVAVAAAVVDAGLDIVEIGDPLIKEAGVRAIETIKQAVPRATVIAEMMSADWGRDQVLLAAEAGADAVLLIGPATTASVSAAVRAGRRLGVPILLDLSAPKASRDWIREMERAGVDAFVITTNIDLGAAGRHPLASARALRAWTQLPICVSGGFSPSDHSIIHSLDWDILIVGRGITEAVNPTVAARQLARLLTYRGIDGDSTIGTE